MLTPLLLAFAATAVAVLLSSAIAAVVGAARTALARRRRREARADEVALLAAAARRWRTTPEAWGGATDGFRGVTFEAVGVSTCRARGGRHTPHGSYRLVHVPPCPDLDAALVRTGHAPGGDGVLVVGWDPETGEDTATIVLGPLVQVPLARVPWGWISDLRRPAAPSADAVETPEPVDRPAPSAPREPRRRRPAPPRPTHRAAPTLRLVHWPDRPPGEREPEPPERGDPRVRWRRAA